MSSDGCDGEVVNIEVWEYPFASRYREDMRVYIAIGLLVSPIVIVLPTAAAVDLVKDRCFK